MKHARDFPKVSTILKMSMSLSIMNYEAEVNFLKLPIRKKIFSVNCARGRGKNDFAILSMKDFFKCHVQR